MGASASTLTIPVTMNKETFQQFAPDHFSNSLFNSLKDTEGLIPAEQLKKFASQATDCFLTHDWGKDELNRDNHGRVAKINARLKELGFRTWFDEEMMRGDIQQQMADGIDNASCVIVFITERYITKVQGKGEKGQLDNCLFEFSHISTSKDRNKIIPVVMEPRCRDTSAWFGKVKFTLGNQLYVDFSSDENVEAVADDIANKMRQVLTDGLTVSERWSKFSERISSDTSEPLSSPHFQSENIPLKQKSGINSTTSPLDSLNFEMTVKLLIHLGCPENFDQQLSADVKKNLNGELLSLIESPEEIINELKLSTISSLLARKMFKKLQSYQSNGLPEEVMNELRLYSLTPLANKDNTEASGAPKDEKKPSLSPVPPTSTMAMKDYKKDENIKINIPEAISVCELKDGQLAFGTRDGKITIFNIQTNNYLTIKAHKDYLWSLFQLSDGRLVTGSNDTSIKIWNLTRQICEITLTGHKHNIRPLCELSDGRLVSGSYDKSIKVWNLHSGNCEKTLLGHSKSVTSIIQLPDTDNTMISSASYDNTIRVWNIETGSCIRVMKEAGPVMIKLSDNRLASNTIDTEKEIKIWNYVSGNCEQFIDHGEPVTGLLQLTDGRLVSGSNGNVKIWKIDIGCCLLQTLSHEEERFYYGGLIEMSGHRMLAERWVFGKNCFIDIWNCSE